MSITLTLGQVALALYVVVSLCVSSAFAMDEMSFVNSEYGRAVLAGFLWPLLVVQLFVARYFGIYFGDELDKLKDKWTQFKCSHDNIQQAGGYEINGREPEQICHECGKVWFDDS